MTRTSTSQESFLHAIREALGKGPDTSTTWAGSTKATCTGGRRELRRLTPRRGRRTTVPVSAMA